MIWVDYVFVGIVVISLLIGIWRGLVREALSLAAWIAAIGLSFRYGASLADSLVPYIESPVARSVVAHVGIFFVVLLLGALIIWLLSRVVSGAGLSGVDRMLGGGFGFVRGTLIVVSLVLLVDSTQLRREPALQHSLLMPHLRPLAAGLDSLLPKHWLASSSTSKASSPDSESE